MSNYLEDIEFYVSEIIRISQIPLQERRVQLLSEGIECLAYSTPHPNGGTIPHGKDAHQRLLRLAETAIDQNKLTGQISSKSVLNALLKILFERFVVGDKKITIQESNRAVGTAIRHVKGKRADVRIFLPCHLGHAESPDQFSIGPITFYQSKRLLDQLKSSFQNFLKLGQGAETVRETLVEKANAYYGSFGWIAEVTIPNCEPVLAGDRAARTIQSALDCLHVLIGASYSSHMRIGGPGFSLDDRAKITFVGRELKISVSRDWLGHNLGNDWCELLPVSWTSR